MSFNVEAASFTPSWLTKKKAAEPKKEEPAPEQSPPPKPPVAGGKSTPQPSETVAVGTNGGESKQQQHVDPNSKQTTTKQLSPDAAVFTPKTAATKPAKPKPALPTPAVSAMEALSKKSVDEVLERAASSSFKVGASFIPANYKPKAPVVAVAGGGAENGPAAQEAKAMVLRDSWSLFFIDRSLVTETNFDPILVFRMDSVEDFCKVFNNIPTAQDMPPQSTYYFFRADIAPKWEDPRNKAGGCWQLRLRSTDKALDDVWERVCAQTIGEKWLFDEHRDAVNGLVLKSRNNFHMLQIWVSEKKQHFPNDLLRAVEEVLPAFDIDYYDHTTMRESSVPQKKSRNKKPKKAAQ